MGYGQFNEDPFIISVFEGKIGYAIEVGCANGINDSPTKSLEDLGWETLCIEPNPHLFHLAETKRKFVLNYAAGDENKDGVSMTLFTLNNGNQTAISGLREDKRLIDSHQSLIRDKEIISVRVRTLDFIINEWEQFLGYKLPEIDFISIDTEGTELDVIDGFDFSRFKPKMIALENNFSDLSYISKMIEHEYYCVNRIGVNDYFIHVDYLDDSDKTKFSLLVSTLKNTNEIQINGYNYMLQND